MTSYLGAALWRLNQQVIALGYYLVEKRFRDMMGQLTAGRMAF